MKASPQILDSLKDMNSVRTQGDLRQIVANALLALARKQISATDGEAMAKMLDSVSNSLNAEIRVVKTKIELREAGAALGETVHLGQMVIGS